MASDIVITPNRGSTSVNAKIDFTGASTASSQIRLEVLPDNSLAFVGTTGSLFSIADTVTGSLMSVNDASGLPILEVFDTDKVVMGQYNQNTLVVNGTKVGIGTASPTDKLTISGVNSNGISFSGSNATLTSSHNLIGVANTHIYLRPGAGYSVNVDSGAGLNVTSGNVYAGRYYDSDNTGYYLDAASNSNLNTFTANNFFGAGNSANLYANTSSSYGSWAINGSKGSYGGIYDAYSGVAWMHTSDGSGGLYKESPSGRWILYHNYSNNSLGIGGSGTGSGYTLYVNGISFATASARAPIFYDSDNTSYYIDAASTSYINGLSVAGTFSAGGSVTSAEAYNSGWFRNTGGAQGLYNTSYDNHFWSSVSNYWNIATSNTGSGALKFYQAYGGTLKGSVYWDGSGFGLLDSANNWSFRSTTTQTEIYKDTLTPALYSNIVYDRQDTSYYTDPNGGTNLNALSANSISRVRVARNTVNNNLGSPTVEEQALIHSEFMNKFRFWSPALQEQSTNGSTWTTSTRASTQNLADMMIGEGTGTSFDAIPTLTVGGSGYYRLTWDATASGSPAYCYLDSFYCSCSTNGNNVTFTIEGQDAGNSSWITITSGTAGNWPGHIYIPHSTLPFTANSTNGYYKKVRVTFAVASAAFNTPITIYGIEWWGGYPSGRRNVEWHDSGKNVWWPAKVNATQFVDSDDTSYYLDPNNYSSVYGLAVRGDKNSTGIGSQLFLWDSGGTTTSAIGFKANGGNFTNPTGNGDGYNTYLTMDSDGRGWVFRRGTGGSDFTAAYTSGWILNNGVWQSNASMRSPIFYDSNDTGYYLDPSSTSNSALRMRGGALFGPNSTWGQYLSVGTDGNASTSYASVCTTNGNLHLDAKSGSNMYLNYYAGNDVYYAYANQIRGGFYADSSFRMPIFYDQDNTGYYLDPAASTSINLAGISKFNSSRTVLRDDSIENWATDTDTASVNINYFGYNSGTTRFRDFVVYDGKGGQKLKVTGSTGLVTIAGSLTVNGVITAPTSVESLRANRSISGGGTISVSSSGTPEVKWSSRFIVISSGRGANFATNGYWDIDCPTSGTITGVGGAANQTANANGIPLGTWTALYYILPIGSGNGSNAANFRLVHYSTDLDIPAEWVLICLRNSDNDYFYFPNGIILERGESGSYGGLQTSANTNNTVVKRNGSGNFSAGTITAALSGNATTATTLQTARNIAGVSFNGSADISITGQNITNSSGNASNDIEVAKYMRWKNYGNNHILIDASAGTNPGGGAIDKYTAQNTITNAGAGSNTWGEAISLMGWNGSNTYGVRVDRARSIDNQANSATITADVNSTANTLVRRDGSGNIYGLEYYAGGWYRSYGAQGIYNQDYAMHFYANEAGYYNLAGNGSTSYGGLRFRSNHQSTTKGLIYWDANGFGLLDQGANWGVRVNASSGYAGGSLYGQWFKASSSNTGGITVPGVFVQSGATSGAPTAIQNGDLWWNTDTGKLKIYWTTANSWVDATPVPDMSNYFTVAGGNINGNVNVNGLLESTGNINARVGTSFPVSIGTHPSYSTLSAIWKPGTDYALGFDGTHTYVNAPSGGTLYFRQGNTSYAYVNGGGITSGNFNGTSNSATLYANVTSTYGSWAINGSKGGYGGIYDAYSGCQLMGDSGGNIGLYREASGGRWMWYHHIGNNCLAISGSTTTAGYRLQVNGDTNQAGNIQISGNICRTDHANGFLVGSYNSAGANESKTNPIYTVGGSYLPTNTSFSNMYGIGYAHQNILGGTPGWALYVAAGGSIKCVFGDSYSWVTGSMRAPIFYDSDNTSYYVDPTGTVSANLAYSAVINSAGSSSGYGLALYPSWSSGGGAGTNTEPTYGMMFASTATYGTYGNCSNATDWATYFTMNNTAGRGWIFRVSGSGNVASISNTGYATFVSLGIGTAASGTSGEIRATNNVTAYYSDERLKTKLGPIENPIEKVKSLSGFYFAPNDAAMALGYKKTIDVGVSAQEVNAILPEVIAPAPIDPQYMTVRYEKLIPLLIEAIKAQQVQIEELQKLIKEKA